MKALKGSIGSSSTVIVHVDELRCGRILVGDHDS